MASDVTLKKGGLSAALSNSFHNYYSGVGGSPAYAARKWQHWQGDPNIVVYRAKKGEKPAGWIVYDPTRSRIEEVLIDGSWDGENPGPQMLDALIAKESLVSAEILKTDEEKYRWMVEYGFRPTRSFTADGFPFVRLELSTSLFLKRIAGKRPARAYRKKERVAIEKIPESQTYDEVKRGLKGLVDKLGGLDAFVKPGQSVVIKPNIVADHGLMGGVYKGGVVTDIRVVKALIELLLPVARKITVAEGASINRSATMKLFALYGYDKLADLDSKKVSIVDLNADALVEKPVPGGKRMLSRKVPLTLEQADVIINVPVMKIHFAAVASLAVKSLQGTMPPLEKYMSHFFGLWQNLVNIHHLVKPKLHIIDGLIGQEDFGPVSGMEKKMDLLIGGTNPVALDAVVMRIMGLDPATSPPVLLAYMQGLGPIEADRIKVIGPSIGEVSSTFKQPELNVSSGKRFIIHDGQACPGCKGYLHFVLAKLRKADPKEPGRLLIDRPFDPRVNIFLGPATQTPVNPEETNVFLGICQQHHAEAGTHLPGCPPHAEVLMKGIFGLFPDVERPRYADKSEEETLEEMLNEVLGRLG